MSATNTSMTEEAVQRAAALAMSAGPDVTRIEHEGPTLTATVVDVGAERFATMTGATGDFNLERGS